MILVFILSALWWIRIRCLWNLPDGRDWLRGKLGLVLMGRAMLSKPLIQFSVDGRSCVISLLLDVKPNSGVGNEGNGGLLQEVPCMHCCPQCLRPWSKPLQRVLKVWSSSHGKVRGPPEMSRWAKGLSNLRALLRLDRLPSQLSILSPPILRRFWILMVWAWEDTLCCGGRLRASHVSCASIFSSL